MFEFIRDTVRFASMAFVMFTLAGCLVALTVMIAQCITFLNH